jgi:hypothetical protein
LIVGLILILTSRGANDLIRERFELHKMKEKVNALTDQVKKFTALNGCPSSDYFEGMHVLTPLCVAILNRGQKLA